MVFIARQAAPILAASCVSTSTTCIRLRLLTAVFTHSDFGHLLANAPLFLIFGWLLRSFFGSFGFPIMALVFGIISNLITVYYYAPTTRLLGASGMVYGMVAFWLVLYIRFDVDRSIPVRLFRVIAFSLIVMFPTTFVKTTSYLAHSAGFATGIIAGIIFCPFLKVRNPVLPRSSMSNFFLVLC